MNIILGYYNNIVFSSLLLMYLRMNILLNMRVLVKNLRKMELHLILVKRPRSNEKRN